MKATEDIAEGDVALNLALLPQLLGFHLRMAHVAIYRDFMAALSELDITQKQAATLFLIDANPGVSQVDLAATLGADRATMMAMIDRLEARDLLERRRSSEDRRRQELRLTDPGVALLARAKTLIVEHELKFTRHFTPAELQTLIEALKRVYQQA